MGVLNFFVCVYIDKHGAAMVAGPPGNGPVCSCLNTTLPMTAKFVNGSGRNQQSL